MSFGVIHGAKHGTIRGLKHNGASLYGGTPALHVAIAGQSNAALRGNSTLVDYGLLATASYSLATIETSISFTPPPGYASQDLGPIAPTGLNSGLELGLGRALVKSGTSTSVLPISKMGIDGTAIATWILAANYDRWVTAMSLRATTTSRPITDIIWVQGEADAGDATLSAAYESQLGILVAKFRVSFPTARIWIVQLNANCTAAPITGPWRDAVRLAQSNVVAANSTFCYLVNPDNIALGTDNAHYTADGFWALGVRLAEAMRAVLGNTLPSESVGGAPFIRSISNSSTSSNTVGASVTVHPSPALIGDTQVLVVSQGNLNLTPVLTTTGGFVNVTNSPQFSLSGGNYAWLSVYTRVWNGTDVDPVVSGLTTQQRRNAFIFTVGGTSGLSMTPVATVNNAFSTSMTIASITTPSANNLVVRIHASYAAANNNLSSVSGGTLIRDGYGPVKQMYQLFADVQAAAGATGACTGTHATTSLQANLVLAFAP